ncbi:MAG: hypothetical protein QNK11_08805 [Legionella sp.]|nr:hypothetical protein [Legionella sp.]
MNVLIKKFKTLLVNLCICCTLLFASVSITYAVAPAPAPQPASSCNGSSYDNCPDAGRAEKCGSSHTMADSGGKKYNCTGSNSDCTAKSSPCN